MVLSQKFQDCLNHVICSIPDLINGCIQHIAGSGHYLIVLINHYLPMIGFGMFCSQAFNTALMTSSGCSIFVLSANEMRAWNSAQLLVVMES